MFSIESKAHVPEAEKASKHIFLSQILGFFNSAPIPQKSYVDDWPTFVTKE